MKHRITYFLHDPSEFDISQIEVKSDALSVDSLDAAKEHRITLGLSELPPELRRALSECYELHLRWTRPTPYYHVSPLLSRSSSGMHLFYTPQLGSSQNFFCSAFKQIFGDDLKCINPATTFTNVSILSERFATGASQQYHTMLSSLAELITYLSHKVCKGRDYACIKQMQSLSSAAYLDIDYDTISHALTFTAFWDSAPSSHGWTDKHSQLGPTHQTEVGILNSETPTEPEELKLGGFLTVIGEDDHPSPTLFAFPSRHQPLPQSSELDYRTAFRDPTGLHPVLQLIFPSSQLESPGESCALHTYLTLPSYLFIDKYQLSDPLFLASQNLVALHSIAGETDLEAPDWIIKTWGSAALLELSTSISTSASADEELTVSIPLHLRYLSPSNATLGQIQVPVPWPIVFWACVADEGTKMNVNPFDRVNLGYDGLFGPRTMFYHVPTAPTKILVQHVRVPILNLDDAQYVEIGTVFAIALGSLWVLWKLLRVWTGGYHENVSKKTQ
ncbi:PIG-X-domain-containing protein [Pseudovirgaria hyperparasitica]|uniref:Protein PBN1 n=1 Tax=Pseudovirgaria hyperparasitica TaxID=470096 RepID=A0A6A6VZH0_9PEZI|nr:PIG-X-domain-containing protein [Pseudovirgaria hyperparasitica]KAF2756058.1 PIG-X-domain-containing protein [Pseudovirgaria hyperparasitica]